MKYDFDNLLGKGVTVFISSSECIKAYTGWVKKPVLSHHFALELPCVSPFSEKEVAVSKDLILGVIIW